jgi:hypothetical protein
MMKTLDEVIKAIEICKNPDVNRNCKDCPMPDTQECIETLMTDALHYLKEYRERYIQVEVDDETTKEFAEMLYRTMGNPPLTWDELKQMEGRPVWYEHEFWKGWIILGKVEQGVNCEMIPDREERWYIVKDGSAKAYRKERE